MNEIEKMLAGELYDANYNSELTCTKRKESGTQRHPQLNDNYNTHDVVCVCQPLTCAVYDTEVKQIRVCYTVCIAREYELPCGIDVTCQSRRIEDKCEHCL